MGWTNVKIWVDHGLANLLKHEDLYISDSEFGQIVEQLIKQKVPE